MCFFVNIFFFNSVKFICVKSVKKKKTENVYKIIIFTV